LYAIIVNEKNPVHPKDLNNQDLILTENGSYRMVLEDMLADEDVRPASVMESASIEAIKKLVVSGLGITLLPRVVALEELRSRQLIDLGWSGPDFQIKSQMIHHKHKWLSPALRAMIDMARCRANQNH
jgi:DNA-binding transcriptional LysR family regulator